MTADYQQLCEEHEVRLGADEARIQAIADVDTALLRDPAIQAVLDGSGSDSSMDEDAMDEYIKTELKP
jgi:hypothetical protein